jgi:hypothetical protein
MDSGKEQRTTNTGFASGGVTLRQVQCMLANLELCVPPCGIQCWLSVLSSETRPNERPETVGVHAFVAPLWNGIL